MAIESWLYKICFQSDCVCTVLVPSQTLRCDDDCDAWTSSFANAVIIRYQSSQSQSQCKNRTVDYNTAILKSQTSYSCSVLVWVILWSTQMWCRRYNLCYKYIGTYILQLASLLLCFVERQRRRLRPPELWSILREKYWMSMRPSMSTHTHTHTLLYRDTQKSQLLLYVTLSPL